MSAGWRHLSARRLAHPKKTAAATRERRASPTMATARAASGVIGHSSCNWTDMAE